jgi:hypothetical protein
VKEIDSGSSPEFIVEGLVTVAAKASIALVAAASPGLEGADPRLAAERGLLIQSAAYSAARAGDRDGMRDLTDEAASIAARFSGRVISNSQPIRSGNYLRAPMDRPRTSWRWAIQPMRMMGTEATVAAADS